MCETYWQRDMQTTLFLPIGTISQSRSLQSSGFITLLNHVFTTRTLLLLLLRFLFLLAGSSD